MKAYAAPTVADVGGVPVMTGAELDRAGGCLRTIGPIATFEPIWIVTLDPCCRHVFPSAETCAVNVLPAPRKRTQYGARAADWPVDDAEPPVERRY